jgi:hypothetical protein
MLGAAKTSPGLGALASLSCVCASYAREADDEIDRRLGLRQLSLPMAPPVEERWLSAREAAPMLQTSARTLGRHWRGLHFCKPQISGHGFRVSLTGIREHMTGACGCDSAGTMTRARGRKYDVR